MTASRCLTVVPHKAVALSLHAHRRPDARVSRPESGTHPDALHRLRRRPATDHPQRRAHAENAMKFMLQVYFNGADERLKHLPEAERQRIVHQFEAFFRRTEVEDGNQLQPSATAVTVRLHDGEVAHSTGPFPTGEPLGGYYIVEASDIDAATAIAGQIPAVRMGAAVEVRALVER